MRKHIPNFIPPMLMGARDRVRCQEFNIQYAISITSVLNIKWSGFFQPTVVDVGRSLTPN